MAICKHCNKDMLKVKGCVKKMFHFKDGERLNPLKCEDLDRCHDCGCLDGYYHHPGCDMEVCPRCKGQVISCGCELKGGE